MDRASYSNSNANFNSELHHGNNVKASTNQKHKKPCCAVKVDTAAKEKTDLGMFYLRNNLINPSDVFLKDML